MSSFPCIEISKDQQMWMKLIRIRCSCSSFIHMCTHVCPVFPNFIRSWYPILSRYAGEIEDSLISMHRDWWEVVFFQNKSISLTKKRPISPRCKSKSIFTNNVYNYFYKYPISKDDSICMKLIRIWWSSSSRFIFMQIYSGILPVQQIYLWIRRPPEMRLELYIYANILMS